VSRDTHVHTCVWACRAVPAESGGFCVGCCQYVGLADTPWDPLNLHTTMPAVLLAAACMLDDNVLCAELCLSWRWHSLHSMQQLQGHVRALWRRLFPCQAGPVRVAGVCACCALQEQMYNTQHRVLLPSVITHEGCCCCAQALGATKLLAGCPCQCGFSILPRAVGDHPVFACMICIA
jgi:hypothetical protein